MSLIRSEQLAKTSKDLMLKEPFYGLFLIMLNKTWTRKILDTAGVADEQKLKDAMAGRKPGEGLDRAGVGKNGINYQLIINENFWDSLTDPQRRGLLKHELLHIGFFHLTDYDSLTDHLIANIAEDIEINQYIDAAELPPGPQLPETYPELKLELKKGTHYYYEKLMQGKQQGNCPNLNAMLAAAAQGAGSIVIHIPGKGDVDTQIPDHSTWGEFEDLNEAEKKLLKSQTEHILKEVADQVQKSRGTVPSEFSEILKRITEVEPPKFDWRGYLRRFSGGSTRIYTKKTRRKFNKRYEDNPGLKIKPRRHILVAYDTSGSVSTNELNEFNHEVYHMHKTGTEVTIIQCDAAISHIGKFSPQHEVKIHGRGGTSFQPVIDYYNENTHKYTCLIYLTDGEAPAPTPARGRMLWVMSSQSSLNEDLVGPQIKLN